MIVSPKNAHYPKKQKIRDFFLHFIPFDPIIHPFIPTSLGNPNHLLKTLPALLPVKLLTLSLTQLPLLLIQLGKLILLA
jgi:hypothetical protein